MFRITIGYRSPERKKDFEYKGQKITGRVSPQSDVYSFGLVMLEVLNKERLDNLENHSLVLNLLNNLETDNEILKKYLPLMLSDNTDKRPTPRDLVFQVFNEEDELIEFFYDKSRYLNKNFPLPSAAEYIFPKKSNRLPNNSLQ